MGLDQYAYINPEKVETTSPEGHTYVDVKADQEFYWRKHSRLQDFMEELWVKKTGLPKVDLNCEDMELTEADINQLEGAWHNSYEDNVSAGGFFYGHQFQKEQVTEYAKDDRDFINAARKALAEGHSVIYTCWW